MEKKEAVDLNESPRGRTQGRFISLQFLNCYSFATKYCCLSNRNDGYYIYDSLVSDVMYKFAREKKLKIDGRAITKKDKLLSEYKNYFIVCEEYKNANNLVGTRRDMDWFLWGEQKIRKIETSGN